MVTRTTRTKTQAIKHNSLTRHIPETNDPEPRVGSGSSVPQNKQNRDDLEWMLNCDVCDIPQVFWKYAKEYGKEYDRSCELQIAKHYAVKKWLTTPDGLEHLLANWPKYTDGKPFRPCDAILCIATRYDNIPAHVFSEIYNK